MKSLCRISVLLFGSWMLVGCASTEVTRQTPQANEAIARPNRIWVYDFAATIGDVPADSPVRSDVGSPSTPLTAQETGTARQLGDQIAQRLVSNIQEMGLSAVQAGAGSSPQVGDCVIRGYLVSVEGGGAAERLVIGFGAGTSELDTVVEAYVVTPQGWRKLGSGTLSSSGNKTPGLFVPAAVAIGSGSPIGLIVSGATKIYGEASGRSGLEGRAKATADEIAALLKIRFQDRGWIS